MFFFSTTCVERAEDEMRRLAAVVHGAVEELSDLHPLRATGYLILSVEVLVVTWYWPKLFPPRSSRNSSRRRRRRFDGFQEGGGRKSEAWYGYGAGGEGQTYSCPSSTYSGSRPPSIAGGNRKDRREGGSRRTRSLSTEEEELLAGRLEALAERQSSFASTGSFATASDTPRSSEAGDLMPQAKNGARRYIRPLVLSALAGLATYLLVYLLLAGDTAAFFAPTDPPMVALPTPEMDGARALREKALAIQKAAAAVGERQEKADRDRAEMAERERKEMAEQQRMATEKQAERQRIENVERERKEKAEQARKAKAEREARERAERVRELEERQKLQLASIALAIENAEAATKARAAQKRDEQLRTSRMATLSQDDPSLVLGQTLSRGSTELKITEKGDLALVTGNKSKWIAPGSKKRRNVITWLWRKLRRRPTIPMCTECRLQVTPSGRLELRDKRKLLWSDGQLTRRRTRKEPGGPCVYRLVVTADGNAELRRGGAEDVVVWQALPAP